MRNKKAFLLAEETLKIVIALICIGFLVYFLVSLYMSNKDAKNLELAKSSLEHLITEVDSGRSEVVIYNPSGWVIGAWPHDTTTRLWYTLFIMSKTTKGLPNYCENFGWEKCICICKKNKQKMCDELGSCFESDFGIDGGSIEIKKPFLKLKIEDNIISEK